MTNEFTIKDHNGSRRGLYGRLRRAGNNGINGFQEKNDERLLLVPTPIPIVAEAVTETDSILISGTTDKVLITGTADHILIS